MDLDEKSKIYKSLIGMYRLYLAPNIPLKKAAIAIKKYAFNINYNDIELLFDDTLFGSGGKGFIVTADKIFYHNVLSKQGYFDLNEINSVYADNIARMFINDESVIDLFLFNSRSDMNLLVSAIKNLSSLSRKELNIPKDDEISLENTSNIQNKGKSTIQIGISAEIDGLVKFNSFITREISEFHFKPFISTKRLTNAIKKYAIDINHDDVIMLYDNTKFGGGAEGLLCTKNAVYSSLSAYNYPLNTIVTVACNGRYVYINGQEIISIKASDRLRIATIIKCFISDLVDISR